MSAYEAVMMNEQKGTYDQRVIILECPDYLHFIPPEQKENRDTQSSVTMEWTTDSEQTRAAVMVVLEVRD